MTTLAAIRTHRWDEDAERLFAQLHPVFGPRLVVVFHNRPEGLRLPLPVIDIDDAWLRSNGLQVISDWGWRCGDYFLYALRAARPDFDFAWLIEPDVWFAGDPAGFFAGTAALDHDLLGSRIVPMSPDHRFGRGLPGMDLWKAIFALTRFSGRAADRLFAQRRDYATRRVAPRFVTNDETFCFSHARAAGDLTLGSLADLLPDWLAEDTVRTDPDILFEAIADRPGPGVFHPVRGRGSFGRAVAARLAANTGFLPAMAPSLALLSEADIAAIAADVAERSAAALRQAARRGNGGAA